MEWHPTFGLLTTSESGIETLSRFLTLGPGM